MASEYKDSVMRVERRRLAWPSIAARCAAIVVLVSVATDSHRSLYAEDWLNVVRQAAIASKKGLVSGEGAGWFRSHIRGKLHQEATFEVAFHGDKYHVKAAYPLERTRGDPLFHRAIVSDGSVMFYRDYEERLENGARNVHAMTADTFASVCRGLPNFVSATRCAINVDLMEKHSIKMEKLANGHLRGTYPLSPSLQKSFEASPDVGYNVICGEVRMTSGALVARFTKEWRREGENWFGYGGTTQTWLDGKERERSEWRFERFRANAPVSQDLFTLDALHVVPGVRMVDHRKGVTTVREVRSPDDHAEEKPGMTTKQIGGLPTTPMKKEP